MMSAENILEKFAKHFNFKIEIYSNSCLGYRIKLTSFDDSIEYPDLQFIRNDRPANPLVYAYGRSKEEACKHYVECFLLDRALDPVWLNSRGKWNELEGFPRSSLEELALFLDLNA